MSQIQESGAHKLKTFFARPVCQRATAPLKDGVEIAVFLNSQALTLCKKNSACTLLDGAPKAADMSFWVGPKAVDVLHDLKTEDIGEIGIAIIKLMLEKNPELQLKAKVHIGSFQLLRNGYLGVLPLGGATVMKFLASKGFSNIGKIKDAISTLRG